MRLLVLILVALFLPVATLQPQSFLFGQEFEPNYDEAKVPQFNLPPILESEVAAEEFPAVWKARRAQLLQTFADQMYGAQPVSPFQLQCELIEKAKCRRDTVLRQQWKVTVTTEHGSLPVSLLVFTPAEKNRPVPTFLGLNFHGNHTVAADQAIVIPTSWVRNSDGHGSRNNRASADGRGKSSTRWPVELITGAGFGVASVYYGDIDPDFHDGFDNGIHALFPKHKPSESQPDRWGSISAWAWGLSRMLDCMQHHIDEVDATRVVVVGHSRLGKTSLWTAATDQRFAGAISNDSGCGGAALSRRAFGETVGRINSSFPHWFCGNFKQYNLNESALPIDQHQLVALAAPRPVYVASASDDRWADPKGEFLSAKIGGEFYGHFGLKGLQLDELPQPNSASVGTVSYHLRDGKHDINQWDWSHYIEFIKQL